MYKVGDTVTHKKDSFFHNKGAAGVIRSVSKGYYSIIFSFNTSALVYPLNYLQEFCTLERKSKVIRIV